MLSITTVLIRAHPRSAARGARTRRGQLGRVDLFDQQVAGGLQRGEVDAHVFHALEEQAQFLIEDEQRGFFARATAAAANTIEISDLPVPAGPRIRLLEPVSTPPPIKASSSRMPLLRVSRT